MQSLTCEHCETPIAISSRWSRFAATMFTTSHLHRFYPQRNVKHEFLPKRVKIEFTDEDGTKYSLAVDGHFSQDKVRRIMEMADLLSAQDHQAPQRKPNDGPSIYNEIIHLIQSSYALKEFSSADIARDYEELHGSSIALSTVSTYLARLADRGNLKRQKFGNSWVYRLSTLSGQLPK